MAKPNYYEILGVGRTATEDAIKQSYRKLARQFHPDVNASPDAESRFKEINKAYDTLSDSLKRADYDQTMGDTGVRRTDAARSQPGSGYASPDATPRDAYSSPYRQAMIRAALARVIVSSLITGVAGGFVQIAVWYALNQPATTETVILGMIPGFLLGALLSADMHFKVETFLGSGWLGRSYTFARTILISLSLAYYLALVGAAIDQALAGPRVATPPLVLLGILIGAVIGSDGDTPEKLRTNQGRFNLFYTLIRGAEVGLIGALIGAAIGGIFAVSGIKDVIGWSIFTGFALGMIVGSIKPANLAAYASYASASVKNIIVMLMIVVALGVGIAFGATFAPQLGTVFSNSTEN